MTMHNSLLNRALRRALRWVATGSLLLCMAAAQANEVQQQLQAVFLGRFASYVQWPAHASVRTALTIAVLGNQRLSERLQVLYAHKHIQNKPVQVLAYSELAELTALADVASAPDVLFIAQPNAAARQAAIAYAQSQGVLSVSDAKGFAEQGGVIQMNFVEQNVQIKINHDAAMHSGLQIGAPLLSIATVLRKNQP